MNHLNVVHSNPVIAPKSTLTNKLVNQLKTKIRKLFKTVEGLLFKIGAHIQQKNLEAAMIENRSVEQMEKRYGPNWISMRGFY